MKKSNRLKYNSLITSVIVQVLVVIIETKKIVVIVIRVGLLLTVVIGLVVADLVGQQQH